MTGRALAGYRYTRPGIPIRARTRAWLGPRISHLHFFLGLTSLAALLLRLALVPFRPRAVFSLIMNRIAQRILVFTTPS